MAFCRVPYQDARQQYRWWRWWWGELSGEEYKNPSRLFCGRLFLFRISSKKKKITLNGFSSLAIIRSRSHTWCDGILSAAVTLQQCCRRVAAINATCAMQIKIKIWWEKGKKMKKGFLMGGRMLHILIYHRSGVRCRVRSRHRDRHQRKGDSGALCTLWVAVLAGCTPALTSRRV